jgi:hypothetical protein
MADGSTSWPTSHGDLPIMGRFPVVCSVPPSTILAPMGSGLVKGVKGSARRWDLGLAGL